MAANLEANALFRVDGMVAVVTGGGSGIGHTMAKALAKNGAQKVYILGRRLEVLQTAASAHEALIPIQCDTTSKDSLQAAVDRITAEAGFVNLVIANAGVLGPTNRWNPGSSIGDVRKMMFTDYSMDEFTQVLHVNVTSAFFTMTAFLELLDAGNKNALNGGFGAPLDGSTKTPAVQSQVVVTSSIAAYSRHMVSAPPYSGSKAAIMHLSKQASSILSRFGIRVNALAPGLFPSELASAMTSTRNPEDEGPDHPLFLPSQRFGGDEEMAGSILYLASRAGSYCNGSVLMMDGGRLSVMPATY